MVLVGQAGGVLLLQAGDPVWSALAGAGESWGVPGMSGSTRGAGSGVNVADSGLLAIALSSAVPLWIEQLRSRDWAYIEQRAKVCSQEIAEHGDNILYRSRKKGETATAFNRLAEGVACLAFAPGGVTIFGQHFEAKGESSHE